MVHVDYHKNVFKYVTLHFYQIVHLCYTNSVWGETFLLALEGTEWDTSSVQEASSPHSRSESGHQVTLETNQMAKRKL